LSQNIWWVASGCPRDGLRHKKIWVSSDWRLSNVMAPACQALGVWLRLTTSAAAVQAWTLEALRLTARQYVQQCKIGRVMDGVGLKVCR